MNGRRAGVRWAVGAVLMLMASGCFGSKVAKVIQPPHQGAKVVVAAIGDGAVLPTVTAQRGEWEESRQASCTVLEQPVEPSNLQGAHVLIFRGDRLGDLVDLDALGVIPESALRPAPTRRPDDADDYGPPPSPDPDATGADADALDFENVIPAYREQVSKYGPDRVALPYGGSALVLVYNRAALARDAEQAAGVAFKPPKTWEELDALARSLHGKVAFGIALPFGLDPEGVGNAIYLARAAALGQHPHHYSLLFDAETMEPRLTSPPFVLALEKLNALKAFAPAGAEDFDAEAARKAFREGRAALLIDRAEKAGRWGGGKAKSIGVAALPGSLQVFDPARQTFEEVKTPNRPSYLPFGGGWLVAVAASATGAQREAALDLAKYLINPETSNRVRSDRNFPMLPVRAAQLGQGLPDPRSAPGVESREWSEAVNATLLAPRVVPGLRIPGADGYLADLAKGRVAALGGEPASSALKRVADAWSGRTKTLGAARQLWHYRRSLNHNLVTSPRPPDR